MSCQIHVSPQHSSSVLIIKSGRRWTLDRDHTRLTAPGDLTSTCCTLPSRCVWPIVSSWLPHGGVCLKWCVMQWLLCDSDAQKQEVGDEHMWKPDCRKKKRHEALLFWNWCVRFFHKTGSLVLQYFLERDEDNFSSGADKK